MFLSRYLQNVDLSAICSISYPRTWKHGTHLTFPFAFLSAWLLPEFLTGLNCTLNQDGKQFNIGRHPRIFNIWHINKISQKLINMLLFRTCEDSLHGQEWCNAIWVTVTIVTTVTDRDDQHDQHSHQHLKSNNFLMLHNMYEHNNLR